MGSQSSQRAKSNGHGTQLCHGAAHSARHTVFESQAIERYSLVKVVDEGINLPENLHPRATYC